MPVKVKVQALKKGQPLKTSGTAQETGRLVINVPDVPDMFSTIEVKDQNNVGFHVDPTQTDAYSFMLPQHQYHGFVKLLYKVMRFSNLLKNCYGENQKDTPNWIPCTVVQCVDPTERKYQVEPNFDELQRRLIGMSDVLKAKIRDLDLNEKFTCDNALSVMSPAEICDWWRWKGLDLVDRYGWVDPFSQVDHPVITQHKSQLSNSRKAFKDEVRKRLTEKLHSVERTYAEMHIWSEAYNDAKLYEAAVQKTDADWMLAPDTQMVALVKKLRTCKKKYEDKINHFSYPMIVEQKAIMKRPYYLSQLLVWKKQINKWLEDVGAPSDNLQISGGLPMKDAVSRDIMHALRTNLEKTENPDLDVYRSVLHYVVDAERVVGRAMKWRPEQIPPHPVLMQVFHLKDTTNPDLDSPEWVPVYLELTNKQVRILAPNESDQADDETTGWYIPLEVFERLQARNSFGEVVPDAIETHPGHQGMYCEINFFKRMDDPVDDQLVLTTINDVKDNTISYQNPDTNTASSYKILNGACVPLSQGSTFDKAHQRYDRNRVDGKGRVNVKPLTFRCHLNMLKTWQHVIKKARLDDMPEKLPLKR